MDILQNGKVWKNVRTMDMTEVSEYYGSLMPYAGSHSEYVRYVEKAKARAYMYEDKNWTGIKDGRLFQNKQNCSDANAAVLHIPVGLC